MMAVDDHLLAFSERRTALIAGISVERLRYWVHDRGLLEPSINRPMSPHRRVRLFDFDGAVDARLISEFRAADIPLQQVSRVLDDIRLRGVDNPLRVEFAQNTRELFWRLFPGEPWQGGRKVGQFVLEGTIDLQRIREHVRSFPPRQPDDIGRVESRRGVVGGRECFAGTRVPVTSVRAWLDRGATDDRIFEAYPLLEEPDLDLLREADAVLS